MIKAPYNFVPLNEKVFNPYWAEEVSHDIPFSDGESGEIKVKITSKSPIYIRNSYQEDVNHQEGVDYFIQNGKRVSLDFCNFSKKLEGNIIEKEYYIPSTSIKGMVRNVFEILSYSKIQIDKKWDKVLGIRDMTPQKYCPDGGNDCLSRDKIELYNHNIVGTAQHYGLINLRTEEFLDYGKVITIKYNEILSSFPNSGYQYKDKSIASKYDDISPLSSINVSDAKICDRRRYVEYDRHGREAQLFMNEHFGEGNEKKYEFVLIGEGSPKDIRQKVIENFKEIYFTDSYKEESDRSKWNVGEYWQHRYENEIDGDVWIPVFYIMDNNTITDIGLTQVFKLHYNKTIKQAVFQNNLTDLTEVVFGKAEKNDALKGRVQFSHFKSNTVTYESQEPKQAVLSEPRPTYYPNYIEQSSADGEEVVKYITLMDAQGKIRGWKRYPLRSQVKEYELPLDDDGNIKTILTTQFKPLSIDTTFEGIIRFHNLKKVEIGALLSALTFHGNNHSHFHSIGMGKPLGYGKIELNIEYIKSIKNSDVNSQLKEKSIDSYLKSFEEHMLAFDVNWLMSEQLKELLAMSDNRISNNNLLEYQSLDNKDFAEDKKNRKYLLRYSQFPHGNEINLSKISDDTRTAEIARILDEHKEWKVIKESESIENIKTFLKDYENGYFYNNAQKHLDTMIKKSKLEKDNARVAEAKESFNAIVSINTKYKDSIIQKIAKFAKVYPEMTNQINELNSLKNDLLSLETKKDINSSVIKDTKGLKQYFENNKGLSVDDIVDKCKEIYDGLRGKRKKNFYSDVQLKNIYDAETENIVKERLKNA